MHEVEARHRWWWPPPLRTCGLGEHVGVEAEALGHGLGVAARGAIGGQVLGRGYGLWTILQLLLVGPHHCGDGGLQAADLIHAALGLEVTGGFHFEPLVVAGTDKGAAPEGMLEAQTEPGKRADGEVTLGDSLLPEDIPTTVSALAHMRIPEHDSLLLGLY